jgi:hypothetical protein
VRTIVEQDEKHAHFPDYAVTMTNDLVWLSLLIENGADRSSISLGDDEHPKSMAVRTTAGKRDARYPYVGERTLH